MSIHCYRVPLGLFRLAIAGLALLAGPGFTPAATSSNPTSPPPNLIVLLTDDQRWDSLGCMGNPIIQTPHLDRLATRGALFRHAFVTTSICSVSRASIFSGQYARRHGIRDFATDFSPEAFRRTYPGLLRDHGYHTGFIGKYGVGTRMPTNEFDVWAGFPGQGRFFDRGSDRHLTRRMGDQAEAFLRNAPRARPFCLSVSFKAPHAQDGAPREFPPDPQDESLYAESTIPVPAQATPAAFERLPAFIQKSEGRTRWARRFASQEMFQATVKDYYRLITGVDREVGRLVALLEQLNLHTNTVIVFTSDNGWFMGEHGMADKWLMFEESVRVPLIIYDPRAAKPARPDGMVLNIDLAPTLLDYAGVHPPSTMQGRSLKPWVESNPPARWRTDWFYEHEFGPEIIPPSEGVRTREWKYVLYPTQTPPVEMLFHLLSDPAEERNRVSDPTSLPVLNSLRARHRQLLEELR